MPEAPKSPAVIVSGADREFLLKVVATAPAGSRPRIVAEGILGVECERIARIAGVEVDTK